MNDRLLTVSSSPHIRSSKTTRGIMTDVALALIPALIAGIIFFGIRALYLTAISVLSCVLFEYIWQKILNKQITAFDGSAVVTGMLLALSFPVTVPWWIVVLGAFFAIIITKQFFGGIGCNFLNPALSGRAFLLASWPVLLTKYVPPFTTGFMIDADVLTSATPLTLLKQGMLTLPPTANMFIGNISGSIGETSAIALLIGGIYLVAKKIISPRIPLCYLATVAVLAVIFPSAGLSPVDSLIYNILGGGLLMGAIFMATDYVTSPITSAGQIIMAVGCGLLTMFIRKLGGYPEGVTYAILLMNIATPLIDKYIRPKKFGYTRRAGR